jgi:hypothetical protein
VANTLEVERYGPDSARITDAAGRTFDVTLSYRVAAGFIDTASGSLVGAQSWQGVFHAEQAFGLKSGEGTLELPDGRTGRVLIHLNVDVQRGESMCTFVGSGAPPTK